MFLTRREPGVPLSLFRPYPLPFSPPFLLYCSLITLPFLHVFFIDLYNISAVVSGEAFYLLFSLLYVVSDPQGTWSAWSLFRPYPLPFSPPFLLYCSLPFLFFYFFFIDLYLLLFPGRHSICCFPRCSHMFLTRREPGVPLSLFRPYPLPFFSSFSSILFLTLPFLLCLFSLTYICCSFRGGILSAVFPTVAICFWPAGNLECPCPLFRSYPLPFSPPFLLYCSLPFLFFYVFFIDLYLL